MPRQIRQGTAPEQELRLIGDPQGKILGEANIFTGGEPLAQSAKNTSSQIDPPLPAIGEIDKYLMATADRADIKSGEATVDASRFDVEAAKANRAPTVTLDANSYPYRDPHSQSEWDIVLSLEIPLFDHGRRVARIAEASQQLRISELRLAELQRSSERDVRQNYQSLFYELRQWSELQTAIGISSDTLTLLQKDYDLGRVNNLDVLSATVQYWELRRREAALANQLRADMVHLHVAAGKVAP